MEAGSQASTETLWPLSMEKVPGTLATSWRNESGPLHAPQARPMPSSTPAPEPGLGVGGEGGARHTPCLDPTVAGRLLKQRHSP